MAHSLAPEQLGAPPLNSLQFASVSLVVGRPELGSDLCKEEKSFINQMRAYTLFSSHSLIKMLNRIGSTVYLKETPRFWLWARGITKHYSLRLTKGPNLFHIHPDHNVPCCSQWGYSKTPHEKSIQVKTGNTHFCPLTHSYFISESK